MSSNPIMDGSPVLVGDVVYDTLYGAGVVEQILVDNRFVVTFSGANLRHTYHDSGVGSRFKVRSLYWHDPVFAIPAKSDTGWQKIRTICLAVVAAMRAA